MPVESDIDRVLKGFSRVLDSGRVAHAYLVVGDPRGAGGELALRMAQAVECQAKKDRPCGICNACRRVRAMGHLDVVAIEPESKSRVITVDVIREKLIPLATRTSHEGGWKVILVRWADRLQDQAANALLKTLEEPPPQTLMLLVTDAPQFLLPTIASRCQRLLMGGAAEAADGEEAALRTKVQALLAEAEEGGTIERLAVAADFKRLLDDERKRVTDALEEAAAGATLDADVTAARANARALELRRMVLGWVLDWQRDLVVTAAGGGALRHAERRADLERAGTALGYGAALERVRRAEEMIRRLDRNLSEDSVFRVFFRDLPRAPAARR